MLCSCGHQKHRLTNGTCHSRAGITIELVVSPVATMPIASVNRATLREASVALETEAISGTATWLPDLEYYASGTCGLSLGSHTRQMCLQALARSREDERGIKAKQIWF